ncbi:MAG: hypothetical protein MUE40_00505 [Anaerolineae bacterium]|nr:hypothetical protein [Anaerolineae bacterium]
MDINAFIAQMAPLFASMILFPLVLLFGFFVARSQWRAYRQRQGDTGPAAAPARPATAEGASALDQLRQAAAPVDPADLPDLDLLLKPEPARARPSALREVATTPQRLRLHTGSIIQAQELLTILRDERDGRLLVQMGAAGYRSLSDAPEMKKAFTTLMKELSGVILTPDTPAADNAEPDFLPAAETPPPAPPVAAAPPPPAPAPAAPPVKKTAPPPAPAAGAMPGDLPSYKFDDNPAKIAYNRSGFVKKVDFVPPPDLDIPSAIEAYLQYKIQYTPEFQQQDIHVRRALDGGVRIQVGSTFYDSVEDVTQPEVKQFLKETIAEWQERQ